MARSCHHRPAATRGRACVWGCGCPHPLQGGSLHSAFARSGPSWRHELQNGTCAPDASPARRAVIELLEPLLTSPWAYLLIFAVAALDAVVPAVPSEATVISAGILAGAGELSLVAVVSAGAAGALIGDTAAFGGGRLLSPRANRWLQRSARGRRESERAVRLLDSRGPLLIITARFIPGGRTAATFTAGIVRYRFRRFVLLAATAARPLGGYPGFSRDLCGRG